MIEWSLRSRACVGPTGSGDSAVVVRSEAQVDQTAEQVDLSDTTTTLKLREPLRVRRRRLDGKG